MSEPETKPRRPEWFKPGQSGNPAGRKPGSKHRLAENLLKALADDFEKFGAATIEKVRIEKPDAYLRVVADLVPKDFFITHDHSLSVDPVSFAARFRTAMELLNNPVPDRIPKPPRLINAARPRNNAPASAGGSAAGGPAQLRR